MAGLKTDGRAAAAQARTPANRLSAHERQAILTLVNQPAFADRPPSQIVPALADQGMYLASESTFYQYPERDLVYATSLLTTTVILNLIRRKNFKLK